MRVLVPFSRPFKRPKLNLSSFQEQMNSVQRAANNMTVPNQKFNGARRRIQSAPQIGSKKRNLHTEDDESSRKRNAAKHSRLFDMIQNPSMPISELTKAHIVPATTPGTLIAEDDDIAEADITSHSHSGSTAVSQLSTLATHQDSTAGNPTSQTVGEAIIALQSGITAEQYPMISTVRTGVQSNIQDISEALTQDKGIEALGEQPYSKLPVSDVSQLSRPIVTACFSLLVSAPDSRHPRCPNQPLNKVL